jgi:photosystem II oxygen-evolving enhancer protein 2
MLKSLIASILIILSVSLFGCSIGVSGLQSYVDATDGYEFLYPNGWIAVDIKDASKGVDVVFRDLVQRSENLSVIISEVDKEQNLEDLGTPTEVGYRFMQMVNNSPNAGREAELVNAQRREANAKNYYILEYEVNLPNNQARHNLASVVVDKGKLFTFNISTTENRWRTVKDLFKLVANSFTVS